MIGPPNHGASLAVAFGNNPIFRGVAGQSGQQLGRDWAGLEKTLATPPFEFGIITGGKNNTTGFNPLISGDNDGTVSVETAKLAGAADFLLLPVLHPQQCDDATVQQCSLRFLQNGYFISEQQRHRLVSEKVLEKTL
jgi:hypothetical protein